MNPAIWKSVGAGGLLVALVDAAITGNWRAFAALALVFLAGVLRHYTPSASPLSSFERALVEELGDAMGGGPLPPSVGTVILPPSPTVAQIDEATAIVNAAAKARPEPPSPKVSSR